MYVSSTYDNSHSTILKVLQLCTYVCTYAENHTKELRTWEFTSPVSHNAVTTECPGPKSLATWTNKVTNCKQTIKILSPDN